MSNSVDLEELKKLCEQATPGPWVLGSEADPDLYRGAETIACASGSMVLWDRVLAVLNHHFPYEADSAFIAAARTALPKLIEEIERSRKAIEAAFIAGGEWALEDPNLLPPSVALAAREYVESLTPGGSNAK